MENIISKFGEKSIQNKNIFEEREVVEFSPQDIENVFANFDQNKSNNNFIAGFVTCFADFIAIKWDSFDDDLKSKIKSQVLQINFPSQISLNFTIRFASFISKIYRLLDNKWDELTSKLFYSELNQENEDLISLIFIFTLNNFEQEQLNSSKQKIIERCFKLLGKTSNTVQIRLLNSLIVLFDNIEFSEEQMTLLWSYIFKIVTERPETLIIINTILTGLFGDYQTIQQLKNRPSLDNNENLAAALRLLFTYNPESTIEILNLYLSKCDEDKTLKDALNNDFLDTIQPEQLKAIAEFLLVEDVSEKIRKFALCAPLIPYVCLYDKEFITKTLEVLRKANEATKFPEFLLILEFASNVIFTGSRYPFITTTIMKLLENDNEEAQQAVKVAKLCFKKGLIKTRPDIKAVLSKYDQIASAQLKRQLILALDALVNNEGFDAFLITPLIDFLRQQMRLTTLPEEIKSACFTLISSIAERDENAPFSLQKELIASIPQLIDGNDESKPAASHVLYFFSEMDPESVRKISKESIDKLFEFAHSSSDVATELRGAVGESLAGIIAGSVSKSLLPKLADLIKFFLESGNRNLGISGSTMIIMACDSFDGQFANDMFIACARAAAVTDYAPLFNSYVEGMRRLSSKVKIGQVALDFALEVVAGFAKVAELEPISTWFNLRTPLYAFFSIIITSMKENAAPLFQYLIMILSDCIDAMVDVVFDPVQKLFQFDLIGDETKKAIIKITSERSLSAKSVLLLDFTNQNIVEFADFAANASKQYLDLMQTEENEEDAKEDESDYEWKGSLGLVLLQLNSRGAELSEDIIEECLLDFPPDPSLGKTEPLAKEVLRISKKEDLSQDMKTICAKVIFDFILLQKPELNKHKVTDETVNQLTESIKHIVKSSKDIEKELHKYCGGVRAKINKLSKLTK